MRRAKTAIAKKSRAALVPVAVAGAALTTSPLPPAPTRRPHRHPSKISDGNWTPKLIASAISQCAALGITQKPLPASKKGLCGNPAPILLEKINGEVKIKPAATLSCPMVASLKSWFRLSVQPLAQKHLGQKIIRIRNISSYVCRNRYGDNTKRISEHAFANALDIAWFEMADGSKVSLLKDWNNEQDGKGAFLHALHKAACGPFGTVLGPEANAAHKNHFHLDMRPRKRSAYCR